MFCGRPQVVPSVHLRRSLGVPPIVARYSSAICSLFVRYLFGPEPDKYRTSTARIPDKTDGKSLPALWVILGSLLPTPSRIGCKYTKKLVYLVGISIKNVVFCAKSLLFRLFFVLLHVNTKQLQWMQLEQITIICT